MTMALRLNLRRCGVLTLSIGPLLLKVCGSSGGTAYIDANCRAMSPAEIEARFWPIRHYPTQGLDSNGCKGNGPPIA